MSSNNVRVVAPLDAAPRRRPRALPALGCAMLLTVMVSACGGGGGGGSSTEPDPNPPPATSSFTSGAITGFGSVIVNGVRFDDSGAEVVDDDGQRHGRDELELGEQVEIEASSIDRASGNGVATQIRVGSELLGPVSMVDTAAHALVVLGQTVSTAATTVFDDELAGGLSAIEVGQVVEVHAQFDAAAGVYRATRIEAKDSASAFKLRGSVAALDNSAKTLRIGDASISYASATEVTGQLALGFRVKVTLQTTPVGGQWIATKVQVGDHQRGDHGEAEMQGLVTAWTSATSFSINGLPVDASHASFPSGQSAVVLGARVEVEGAIVEGVLVATKVQVEDEHEDEDEAFELHGAISAFDAASHSFTLRGVVVAYSDTTVFRDVSADDLAVGRHVEVKGRLSADGTRVEATRISLED